MTRYYHDAEARTLYAVGEPTVFECKKPKSYVNPHPPIDCWSISRKVAVTRGGETADEFIDEEYQARSYQKDEALAAFDQLFAPGGVEIDRVEYDRLLENYRR